MSRVSVWMVLLLFVVAATGTGCAKARAEMVPAGPPLAVPPPPERAYAPPEAPPVTELDPEPLEPAVATPPARPAGRPAAETRPRPAPPAAQPSAPAEEAAETRELRPAPFADTAAAERSVRDALTRAARDIGRVDHGRLSAAGRAQYEQSKRFSEQAEQALKERNYAFAATLADKAATLAAELAGR